MQSALMFLVDLVELNKDLNPRSLLSGGLHSALAETSIHPSFTIHKKRKKYNIIVVYFISTCVNDNMPVDKCWEPERH